MTISTGNRYGCAVIDTTAPPPPPPPPRPPPTGDPRTNSRGVPRTDTQSSRIATIYSVRSDLIEARARCESCSQQLTDCKSQPAITQSAMAPRPLCGDFVFSVAAAPPQPQSRVACRVPLRTRPTVQWASVCVRCGCAKLRHATTTTTTQHAPHTMACSPTHRRGYYEPDARITDIVLLLTHRRRRPHQTPT